MNREPSQIEQSWDAATFEGNEREQLHRMAKLPFAEKIRWLEEAQRLSVALQQARAKSRPISEGPLRRHEQAQ